MGSEKGRTEQTRLAEGRIATRAELAALLHAIRPRVAALVRLPERQEFADARSEFGNLAPAPMTGLCINEHAGAALLKLCESLLPAQQRPRSSLCQLRPRAGVFPPDAGSQCGAQPADLRLAKVRLEYIAVSSTPTPWTLCHPVHDAQPQQCWQATGQDSAPLSRCSQRSPLPSRHATSTWTQRTSSRATTSSRTWTTPRRIPSRQPSSPTRQDGPRVCTLPWTTTRRSGPSSCGRMTQPRWRMPRCRTRASASSTGPSSSPPTARTTGRSWTTPSRLCTSRGSR